MVQIETKNFINKKLKCNRNIIQLKKYYNILKQIVINNKNYFIFIIKIYLNFIKSSNNIKSIVIFNFV